MSIKNALLDRRHCDDLGWLIEPAPLSPFAPLFEPEVPESQRAAVAWDNLPGSGHVKRSESGRLICFFDYGDRNSPFGWEIDHRMPLAFGGRHTRSNLIARHWEDNAEAGGKVGAMMNALLGK